MIYDQSDLLVVDEGLLVAINQGFTSDLQGVYKIFTSYLHSDLPRVRLHAPGTYQGTP